VPVERKQKDVNVIVKMAELTAKGDYLKKEEKPKRKR